MSRSLRLICTQCRKTIWVGQRSYLYFGEPETMKAMETFLVEHMNHPLMFVDDNHESSGEYEDVTPDSPRRCLSMVKYIMEQKAKEGVAIEPGSTAFKSLLAWSDPDAIKARQADDIQQ